MSVTMPTAGASQDTAYPQGKNDEIKFNPAEALPLIVFVCMGSSVFIKLFKICQKH